MLFFVLNDKGKNVKYGKLLKLEGWSWNAEYLAPTFALLEIHVYSHTSDLFCGEVKALANMFVRLFFRKSAIYDWLWNYHESS
jgi:hypothetical protein